MISENKQQSATRFQKRSRFQEKKFWARCTLFSSFEQKGNAHRSSVRARCAIACAFVNVNVLHCNRTSFLRSLDWQWREVIPGGGSVCFNQSFASTCLYMETSLVRNALSATFQEDLSKTSQNVNFQRSQNNIPKQRTNPTSEKLNLSHQNTWHSSANFLTSLTCLAPGKNKLYHVRWVYGRLRRRANWPITAQVTRFRFG